VRFALLLAPLALVACSERPATSEQITAAVAKCGLGKADVRNDDDGNPAWFWESTGRILDDDLDCVRDRLASEGASAKFFDRSLTDAAE
jgi:hypothetical protein